MTYTREQAGGLLAEVLKRSDYTGLAARRIRNVEIHVDREVFLLDLDAASRKVTVQPIESTSQADSRVDCEGRDLANALAGGCNVAELTIRTGPEGQVVHPRVERLLLRCFECPPFPIDDREELILPALFGFEPPQLRWESQQNLLRVLQYQDARSGSFVVSSGLSEPWAWRPAEIYDESVSGAGYELVVKTNDPRIAGEFTGWLKYIERSESHILPGNWLEFEGGATIPGTDVAGFLVVRPLSFLPDFPVGGLRAYWHQLLPVDTAQLEAAKRISVFAVAESIEY